MKKFISILTAIVLTVSFMIPIHAKNLDYGSNYENIIITKTLSDVGDFSYKQDKNKVIISLKNKITFLKNINQNIIIACYDNDLLLKTEIIKIDEYINEIKMNDFTVELPYEPEKLKVKAFQWTDSNNTDKLVPLCEAKELSDVPEVATETTERTTYKVRGRVTETSHSNYSVDSDKVAFLVENSKNFNGETIEYNNCIREEMYIGDTDIDKHLGEFVEAYIVKNEDTEEYTILKYEVLGDVSKTIDILDIDSIDKETRTIKMKNGEEYSLASGYTGYLNGVERYDCNLLDELAKLIPDDDYKEVDDFIDFYKYLKVRIFDNIDEENLDGDGIYDFMMIEEYSYAVIEKIVPEDDTIKVYFSEISNGLKTYMKLHLDWGDYYKFTNEKGEKCDISQLYDYIGKKIYISYDTNSFEDSDFYDIILEGAEPKDMTAPTNDGLTSAEGNLVLKYSEENKTACLDGKLTMESGGDKKYDINIDLMCGDENLFSKTIHTDCRINGITFGVEAKTYYNEDYKLKSYEIPVSKKPDRAIISFDTGNEDIEDIEVPVISMEADKVYGRVISIDKENGTVEFQIENSNNFEGNNITADKLVSKTVKIGNTDADNHLFEYSVAYISKENDEYTLEYLKPILPTVTALVEDIDEDKTILSDGIIYIYPHGTTQNSVKYYLFDEWEFIVDRVVVEATDDNINKYLQHCESITLVQISKVGATSHSDAYRYIKINGYNEEE